MNNNLKNIPKQFLKNSSYTKEYSQPVYITSTQINNTNQACSNDNIWFLILILVIFDII